ncbi:wolframin [Elysia marginata]|uniref:Wolframin n=1 Tax=Elysia marginata TaxID=1093978 RepID=A0AAV4IGS2_9GAST|nr:wolframin [Elysia marginata]
MHFSRLQITVEPESNLAEWKVEADNGSLDHQFKIACHHLKLAEVGSDGEINGEQAVYWFIKASQRGHEEATEKLRHCVVNNIGVNDSNKSDALWCLNTSASEKRIRYAARSLFSRLGGGQGGVISKDEYIKAINSMTAGHEKERKILLAAGKSIGDTITENDFVKTVSKKIQGTLTLTAEETDETSAAYNAASPVRKVLVYPRETAKIIMDRSLEYASKEGLGMIMALIPTNQIYLLAMVFFYSYLKAELFLLVIPLLVFFISFLVLVVATLQMFYKKRKQKDANSLTSLLQSQFDTNIDIESTESQYSWNSLTPYYVFFGILPVMVVSFSFANKSYIPCAEMVVVAMAMTGLCFFGLADSHDHLTFAALAAHTFASLPILLGNIEISIISKIVGFITHPVISLRLGMGIYFNLSLPSLVHMLIPFLFLRMAMKGGWSGVLKTLVPHLVCYCWFSFVIAAFPSTTWLSLVRATAGYLLLPLFVPVSLLAFIFGILFFLYKLLQTEMVGKLIVTGLLIAIPVLLTQTKLFFGKKSKAESPKAKKMKRIVMVGFSAAAILPLLFVRVPSLTAKKHVELSQEDYLDLCVAGGSELTAPYQMRCRDFIGTRVNWTGQVSQVKVVQTENTAESVIKSLPSIIAQPLYCIYGDPWPECDEGTMSEKALRHCKLMESAGQTCHLHRLDQISFSLDLSVGEGKLAVALEANDAFRSRLLALEPGDDVQFVGTLLDAGTSSIKMKLRSLKCISRQLPVMEDFGVEIVDEELLLKMTADAVAMTFNFGLFPLFSFSPEL